MTTAAPHGVELKKIDVGRTLYAVRNIIITYSVYILNGLLMRFVCMYVCVCVHACVRSCMREDTR